MQIEPSDAFTSVAVPAPPTVTAPPSCMCTACGSANLQWCTFSLSRTRFFSVYDHPNAEAAFCGFMGETLPLPNAIMRGCLLVGVCIIAFSNANLVSGLVVTTLSLFMALALAWIRWLIPASSTCCSASSSRAFIAEYAQAIYILAVGLVLILDDVFFTTSSCYVVTDLRGGFYIRAAGCARTIDFELCVTFVLFLAVRLRAFWVVAISLVHYVAAFYAASDAYGLGRSETNVRIAFVTVQQIIVVVLAVVRERMDRTNFEERHEVLQGAIAELDARDELYGLTSAQHLMRCPRLNPLDDTATTTERVVCVVEVSQLQDLIVTFRHSPQHLHDTQMFLRFLLRAVEISAQRYTCAVVATCGDGFVLMSGERAPQSGAALRDAGIDTARIAHAACEIIFQAGTKALRSIKRILDSDSPHHAAITQVVLRAGICLERTRVAVLSCASQAPTLFGPGQALATAFARHALPGEIVTAQPLAKHFPAAYTFSTESVAFLRSHSPTLICVFAVNTSSATDGATLLSDGRSGKGGQAPVPSTIDTTNSPTGASSPEELALIRSELEPAPASSSALDCLHSLSPCACDGPVSNQVLRWAWSRVGFFLSARTEAGFVGYEATNNYPLQVAANASGFAMCTLIMFGTLAVAPDFIRQVPCSISACALMLLVLVVGVVTESWALRTQYAQLVAVEFVILPLLILALGPFSPWDQALRQLLPSVVTVLLLPILWASNFSSVCLAVFLTGMRILAWIATGHDDALLTMILTEVGWLILATSMLGLRTLGVKAKYLRLLDAKIVQSNAAESRKKASEDFTKMLASTLINRFRKQGPITIAPGSDSPSHASPQQAVDNAEQQSPGAAAPTPILALASVLTFQVDCPSRPELTEEALHAVVLKCLVANATDAMHITYACGMWQIVLGLSDATASLDVASEPSFDVLQRLCYAMGGSLTHWNAKLRASLIRGIVSAHVMGLSPRVHLLGAPLFVGRRLALRAEYGTLVLCDFATEPRRIYRDDVFMTEVRRLLDPVGQRHEQD